MRVNHFAYRKFSGKNSENREQLCNSVLFQTFYLKIDNSASRCLHGMLVVQCIFDAFARYLFNNHLDIWFSSTIALSSHVRDSACSAYGAWLCDFHTFVYIYICVTIRVFFIGITIIVKCNSNSQHCTCCQMVTANCVHQPF